MPAKCPQRFGARPRDRRGAELQRGARFLDLSVRVRRSWRADDALLDRLGVQAVVNGNAVSLRGPEQSRETAKSVLEQLYGRLAQGEMIGVGEVVGAIRHADKFEPQAPQAKTEQPQIAEIPAAQQLLGELHIAHNTITLDALHCQKKPSRLPRKLRRKRSSN